MSKVRNGRVVADYDEDFSVFTVGMRVNRLWKVHGQFETSYFNMPLYGLAKATATKHAERTDPEDHDHAGDH